MKRIGSVAKDPALAAALGQLEAHREARSKKAPGSPQDAPGRPSEAGGVVQSLQRERAVRRALRAAQLEALAKEAGMDPEAASRLADGIRAQAPQEWTFIMISPNQNAAVVRWLTENSKRPLIAARLWARLFEVIRNDTGEVMASRSDLAAHLGVEPRTLSELMTELASINAIRRERIGRGVRYFMNTNVATHIPGSAARKAAREADGPLLRIMDGGRS
jgi:DNA-binding transcriptional ArsR family regulator